MKGKLGKPFVRNPDALWRRYATPEELKEIAALDVVIAFWNDQLTGLQKRRFRICNRANSRGYLERRRTDSRP